MGRKFPVGDVNIGVHHLIISVSLFISCIAATIAVVSPLCGSLSKKKTQPSSAADQDEMKENKGVNETSPDEEGTRSRDSAMMAQGMAGCSENAIDIAQPLHDDELQQQQQLPPPPGRDRLSGSASYHIRSNSTTPQVKFRSHSTASKMNLISSRSMRVLGNGLMSASKREDNDKSNKDKKLKHEDSIWKKRIILGEKCRVPDEDDDTILYDEKGKRISAYHPKNTNSMVLSRESSNNDQDELPN